MERLSFKEWQVLSDLEVLDSIPEDFEFSMARGELKTIKRSVDRIMKHLGGEGDLEAWVQSKITKANDYLNSVSNHMDGGEDDTKKEVKEGKIGKECSCCGDTITEDGCGCGPECGHCGGKGKVEESLKEEKCGDGMYYCKTSKKCKKIPKGYRVGKDGMLVKGVRWQDSDGDGKWYEPGDDVSEGIMPEPIDPKKHRDAQKKQKMRNLAIGNENPNEKKVAEKKAGGPKMMGEATSRPKSTQRAKLSKADAHKRQAKLDRISAAKERSGEVKSSKPTETPAPKREKREKVDPRLERAGDQIIRQLRSEGKYSDSETYVKGTAPVRATYGGKTDSFTKETYKKKSKKLNEGAVEDLEKGMETLKSITYDSIDGLMKRIAEDHDISTTKLHYMFKAKHDMTPDDWAEKNLKEEMSNWRQDLDEKCWKGYEKKGMKTMFGKRYPNCVKKEEVEQIQEKPGDGYLGPTMKVGGSEVGVPNPIRIAKDAADNTNRANQRKVDAVKAHGGTASMPPYKLHNKQTSKASQTLFGMQKQSYEPQGEVIGEEGDDKVTPINKGKRMDAKKQAMKDMGKTPYDLNTARRRAKGQGILDNLLGKPPTTEEVVLEKRDGKSAKSKGYSLRDWFKGGGWVQAGGKYDGKPCAKQPGQTTKPFCRDADDRAAMTKDEREKRAAKKRREDPNPERKGKAKIVTEGKEDKARRSELAKKHGIDMTKPGSRAKLARLMKADTISKKRKESGDVRTDKEVRKDNAINRKEIDKERQHLKQSKTKKGTEARRRVDKKMDDFRRELRSSDKPAEAPPTREKVKVQVGTKVDKPADAPKTGRNKPTAEKRADRKSYEAQQRRNQKGLTEKTEEIRYCPKCKKPETRSDCRYGVDYWDANAKAIVAEKKDACYHKVKSRYSVWPSAYASGALVKCRKVGAKNWGNKTKKEGYEFSDWRDDFKPTEIQSFDIVKAEPLVDVNSITEPVQLATEDYQRLQSTGNVFCIMLTWRGQPYKVQLFFPGGSRPSREEVKGEVDKLYPGAVISHYYPAPTDPTQPIVVIQR